MEQLRQVLVEALVAHLAVADDGLELVVLAVEDVFAGQRGHVHDLHHRDAAFAVAALCEALAEDALQIRRKLRVHQFVLLLVEQSHDALDGHRGVGRVNRCEDQVARVGRTQRGDERERVAHLADEHGVRVLTHGGAKGVFVAVGVGADLDLRHQRLLILVLVFDGVFNGENTLAAGAVDGADDGGQGGGFAGTGRSADQHQAAVKVGELLNLLGQVQFVKPRNGVDDAAHDHGRLAAAVEAGDTETSNAFLFVFTALQGVAGVATALLVELVPLFLILDKLADEADDQIIVGLAAIKKAEPAINADDGRGVGLEVQVAAAGGDDGFKELPQARNLHICGVFAVAAGTIGLDVHLRGRRMTLSLFDSERVFLEFLEFYLGHVTEVGRQRDEGGRSGGGGRESAKRGDDPLGGTPQSPLYKTNRAEPSEIGLPQPCRVHRSALRISVIAPPPLPKAYGPHR